MVVRTKTQEVLICFGKMFIILMLKGYVREKKLKTNYILAVKLNLFLDAIFYKTILPEFLRKFLAT